MSNDYNTETINHLKAKVAAGMEVDADATDNHSVNIRLDAKRAQENLDALKVSCPNCKAGPGQICVWKATHSWGAMHIPRRRKAGKK